MSEQVIHAASWLINPDMAPVSGGAVLVQDGVISATGTMADLKRKYSATVVEYPGCALLPGFVNAHTHLELTHFSAWRLRTNVDYNPRRFTDWIIQLIKIARGLTPDDYLHSVREGLRMCLDSGTTAIGEIVSNLAHTGLYAESSLAGRLYFEVLGQDPVRFNEKLDGAIAAAVSNAVGPKSSGLSPHAPYTIGIALLPVIRDAAAAHNLPLAIHISESSAETDFVFDCSGPLAEDFYPFVGWERYLTHPLRCSSTELLDRHGLLNKDTLAVHCVHVTLADARLLKERGVSIAICPRSNDKLDVGLAPVALFKKLGIPLALGTDSLASNDSLSLWDEMRFALQAYPQDLDSQEVLRMATIGGATALGIAKKCGSLSVGKRADFQVVSGCGDSEKGLVERVVSNGCLKEVYSGGKLYIGSQR